MKYCLLLISTLILCSTGAASQWHIGLAPGVVFGELDGSHSYIPWFDSSRIVTFGNSESSTPSLLLRACARYDLNAEWSFTGDVGYNHVTSMLSTLRMWADTTRVKTSSSSDTLLIQKTQPRAQYDLNLSYICLTTQCRIYKQLRLGVGAQIGTSTTKVHGAGDYDPTTTPPEIKMPYFDAHQSHYYLGLSRAEESHTAFSFAGVVRLNYCWELNKRVNIIPCVEYSYSFLRAIPSTTMRLQTLSYVFILESSF